MENQRPKTLKCPKCSADMKVDQFGRNICPSCDNNKPPKDLYEEAIFDLKDYK